MFLTQIGIKVCSKVREEKDILWKVAQIFSWNPVLTKQDKRQTENYTSGCVRTIYLKSNFNSEQNNTLKGYMTGHLVQLVVV